MACVNNCAGRKVVCTCPRDDQQDRDKKSGWPPVTKKPDEDYVPKERK